MVFRTMLNQKDEKPFKGLNEVPQTKPGYWTIRFRAAVVGFVIAILAVFGYREFQKNRSVDVPPVPDLNVPIEEPNSNTPVPIQDQDKSDKIILETPMSGGVIASPLKFSGRARGTWYFEASFPVVLVDWDGRIIAQSHAQAVIDQNNPDSPGWMTEEFVPFEGTIEFATPYKPGDQDFMKRGALILQKDNPSGLPEHDDALEIQILFSD